MLELNNHNIAFSITDGYLNISDAKTGKLNFSLEKHTYTDPYKIQKAYITSMIQCNNDTLATGSNDATIQIYDINLLTQFTSVKEIMLGTFLIDYYRKNKTLPNLSKEYSYLATTYMEFSLEIMKAFNALIPKSLFGNFYSKALKTKKSKLLKLKNIKCKRR